MRKKYIVVLLAGAMLVGYLAPDAFVSAASASVEALRAQVDALLLQVERLQAELNQLKNSKGGPVAPIVDLAPIADVSPPVQVSNPGLIDETDSLSKFDIGDRIRTNDHLRVRTSPEGSTVTVLPPGTLGIISGGPLSVAGYVWWKVDYDTKLSGWSAGDWLEKADNPSKPSDKNPPVFSNDSFVSPTSVEVNDRNWWKVQATDPEGGAIDYRINWGDGESDTYTLNSGASIAAYHVYSKAGMYRITVTATDGDREQAVRYLTVEVLGGDQLKPSQKFSKGDRVEAVDYLNVRTAPNGIWKATVKPGTIGQILGGPVWSIVGQWWWNVLYDDGVEGWSAEGWLKKTDKESGETGGSYACGDINADGKINMFDVDTYNDYIFNNGSVPDGVKTDLNRDGVPDSEDLNLIVDYVTGKGPIPTCGGVITSPYQCGDLNLDGDINELDLTYMTNYLFFNSKLAPGVKADFNGDGVSDAVDSNILVDYIHAGGPAPTCAASTPPRDKLPEVDSEQKDNSLKDTDSLPEDDSGAGGENSQGTTYACGDTNGDGEINLSDVDALSGYLFNGQLEPVGGADLNNDGRPDVLDLNALIDYVNGEGAVPECGAKNRTYSCGDLNLDGEVDEKDAKYMQNYLFFGKSLPKGVIVDFNGDGNTDAVDLNLLVDQVYHDKDPVTCSVSGSGGSGNKLPSTKSTVFDIFRNFFKSL